MNLFVYFFLFIAAYFFFYLILPLIIDKLCKRLLTLHPYRDEMSRRKLLVYRRTHRERSWAFNLWTHLNAVITSCYSAVLDLDICRWMCEFALGIRTWTLISLKLAAYLQLKPSRILSIQQIAHVYHCSHNLCSTAQTLCSTHGFLINLLISSKNGKIVRYNFITRKTLWWFNPGEETNSRGTGNGERDK